VVQSRAHALGYTAALAKQRHPLLTYRAHVLGGFNRVESAYVPWGRIETGAFAAPVCVFRRKERTGLNKIVTGHTT